MKIKVKNLKNKLITNNNCNKNNNKNNNLKIYKNN